MSHIPLPDKTCRKMCRKAYTQYPNEIGRIAHFATKVFKSVTPGGNSHQYQPVPQGPPGPPPYYGASAPPQYGFNPLPPPAYSPPQQYPSGIPQPSSSSSYPGHYPDYPPQPVVHDMGAADYNHRRKKHGGILTSIMRHVYPSHNCTGHGCGYCNQYREPHHYDQHYDGHHGGHHGGHGGHGGHHGGHGGHHGGFFGGGHHGGGHHGGHH